MSDLATIGKYQIRREIGKGSMGVVYEAYDPFIERTVAIKTIRKSMLESEDANDISVRFLREAKASGRLTHPNIVSVYEYGEEGDIEYIVMELVHGVELKKLFDKKQNFSQDQIIHLMSQLLLALEYSHSKGVIHRDIKPANLMITDDQQLKIADFGIAKIDATQMTRLGTVLGTPAYMSPEQVRGLDVDHRTDIYAAGVILYQFLTNARPFDGTIVSVVHKILHEQAPLPSVLNTELGTRFDAVVCKALAKDAAERYQSAQEFCDAIKQAIRNPVADNHHASITPTEPIAATTAQPASPSTKNKKFVVLGALLLSTLAAGIWMQTRTQPTSQPLALTMSSNKQQGPFLPGEKIILHVTPSRDAHVYCFMQDEKRSIARFFPNRFVPSSFVRASQGVQLPSDNSFNITANQSGVQEQIICFATEQDIFSKLQASIGTGDIDVATPLKSLAELQDVINRATDGKAAQVQFNVVVKTAK